MIKKDGLWPAVLGCKWLEGLPIKKDRGDLLPPCLFLLETQAGQPLQQLSCTLSLNAATFLVHTLQFFAGEKDAAFDGSQRRT